MKMIGNVSDWLSYAGGVLIKVAESAGSTVLTHLLNLEKKIRKNKRVHVEKRTYLGY